MASSINWGSVGSVQRSFDATPKHSVSNEGIADFMAAMTDVLASRSRKEAVEGREGKELEMLESELAELEREKTDLEAQLVGSNFVHGGNRGGTYDADSASMFMAGFNPAIDTGRM